MGSCKGLCVHEPYKYCNKKRYEMGYGFCSVCVRTLVPNEEGKCYCCNRFIRSRPVVLPDSWEVVAY